MTTHGPERGPPDGVNLRGEIARLEQEIAALKRENAQLQRDIDDTQEQQAAATEMLQVISRSAFDLAPVLETMVDRASRLCAADVGVIFRFDGQVYRLAGSFGRTPELKALVDGLPVRHLRRPGLVSRVDRERRTVHIRDLREEQDYPQREVPQYLGHRTALGVPMLRDGACMGVFVLSRMEVRPFTDKQIELVQTFADQAVIAIENVRLFQEVQTRNRELADALEQQTITAEILRAMSRSPIDLQAILDAVAEDAAKLCDAGDAIIFRVDGSILRRAAVYGPINMMGALDGEGPPVDRSTPAGRAVVDRETIHVEDVPAAAAEFPGAVERSIRLGVGTFLGTPLLQAGEAIGVIVVNRAEVQPFSERDITLLKTFADQAVIAIENARLFEEIQARNRDLAEALEQQTATAEVLQVLSRSAFDLGPVLQTLVENAARLCSAEFSQIFRLDGEVYRMAATYGATVAITTYLESNPVRRVEPTHLPGRVAIERRVVHIPDRLQSPEHQRPDYAEFGKRIGYRTALGVPLLREGVPIGVLTLGRMEARPFTEKQIELVKTFADQAVIAIENVRLFQEIEEQSRQLETVSRHKSEFLANMSHELRTPLNAIIGFSEVLLERMFGDLSEKQDEYLQDILGSGRHLLSLINDVLDLSKVEAGRMELELSTFALPEVLNNGLTMLKERAGRHGIALALTVDPAIGEVEADERKLKQVVFNLLSNAVKFTPDGGRVELSACLADGELRIAVQDSGVGIAAADQQHVFDEFRQVGHDAAKTEGTGLGLALVKRFVELHGGRIWVESQEGAGSTFTFTLPMQRPAPQGAAESASAAPVT